MHIAADRHLPTRAILAPCVRDVSKIEGQSAPRTAIREFTIGKYMDGIEALPDGN